MVNLPLFGRAALIGVVLSCAAACGNESTPTTPSATTSPGTETFSSSVAPAGSSFRVFTVSTAGTVSVTLTLTSPAGLVLGLGIGVPGGAGGCDLASALRTTAGSDPQLRVAVDAGSYCAGVYDPGTLGSGEAGFALTITHP